jgi:hypothetical protein
MPERLGTMPVCLGLATAVVDTRRLASLQRHFLNGYLASGRLAKSSHHPRLIRATYQSQRPKMCRCRRFRNAAAWMSSEALIVVWRLRDRSCDRTRRPPPLNHLCHRLRLGQGIVRQHGLRVHRRHHCRSSPPRRPLGCSLHLCISFDVVT